MKKIKRLTCIIMSAFMIVSAPLTSYIQAQAADLAVVGGLALKDIVMSLLMSAGLVYAGYETSIRIEKNSIAHESLERAIKENSEVMKALADANDWQKAVGESSLPDNYSYTSSSGFRVIKGGKGNVDDDNKLNKGISVGLTAGLITAARNAVKVWLESEENDLVIAESDEEAGKVNVNFEYMTSITTTVETIPSVSSMSDIDSYFAIDGAYNYLTSQGYSDSEYYFLIYASGSVTAITPIPMNYSIVASKASWLGRESVNIVSNANYKNLINQNGVRDSSSFLSYLNGLPKYTPKYYRYDHSADSWTVHENGFLPGYSSFKNNSLNSWYTCNYQRAYAKGCTISWNFFTVEMLRILYTYKTVTKNIFYNPSIAPVLPSSGYVDFSIPESDYTGFDWTDLSAFLEYISTLSATLDDWYEESVVNQETLIQQNKNVLEAMNKISSTIHTISTNIGKSATAVSDIYKLMMEIPEGIAVALSGSITLPGLEELAQGVTVLPGIMVNGLVDAFPTVITDALVEVFPDVGEVTERIISLPQDIASAVEAITINIPEIKIPEITVPDVFVEAPAITLNPSYEITVQEDYLVLGNVISDSVNGVITDVFVPNEAATLEKVGEMQEYFKFTEDMEDIVTEFKKSVFGITPSPILKIPIGKPKSKKYNYGTGSYIIIDVSWYAEYKDFGDKIILAFAWVFFIWRMFVLLPGIINGTVGGFFTPQRVEGMALDAEIRKNYADLHKINRSYTFGGVYGRFTGKFKD